MSALVSHPTGNANLRAVLRGLEDAGALAEFWTTLALPSGLAKSGWLLEATRRRLSQRSFPEAPWSRTRLRPYREATRLVARGAKFHKLTRHEIGWASVDGVYHDLDRAIARRLRTSECKARAVYAYEDGAYESFLAASETERICIYDLPIAHWRTLRRLLEEEAERLPDWAPTMDGLRDSAAKQERKDAEIDLADHIFVASSFTKRSLEEHFGKTDIHVAPYGCPTSQQAEPNRRTTGAPMRLFFAGHLTQRKGLGDLIAALGLLEIDWRLTLAGPLPLHVPYALDTLLRNERVDWLGVVPHATLLEQMSRSHVFVFPSIVEGFGMVITEALSRGLPVITTSHTCGPDLLEESVDGFIVPIRSPETIAERITRLGQDDVLRQNMGQAALDKARKLSWSRYEEQIADLVTAWVSE